MDDAQEKLRYAEWVLDHGTSAGEAAQAAWEHVTHMSTCGVPELTREAWRIIEKHREYIVWRNL